MLKTLWELILRLFGIEKSITDKGQMQDSIEYMSKYEDTSKVNFTSIFASKITSLAVSESTADVVGENERAKQLDSSLVEVWSKLKKIVAGMLGAGGCVVVPYVKDNKILFDIVSQDRLIINEKQGEKISSATLLAETKKHHDRMYYRWVDYKIVEGTLYISNKITNESGGISSLDIWDGIEDRAIKNVDRVIIAYFKSPIDNRRFADSYGVPLTYGCESIINEIYKCLDEIKDEYDLKQARIFADDRMFKRDDKGNKLMPSKMFVALQNTDTENTMLEVFSPDIRDSSYYTRLMSIFEMLEKAVGTSKGILTAPETRGATATEIKASLYDTYVMITDVRAAIEKAIKDYIYACDVLLNYYSLAAQGNYEIVFDWSYSLIESSVESWQQLKDANALGIKSKAELRQWLNPNESIEEAMAKVEEIKRNEPSLSDLIGR